MLFRFVRPNANASVTDIPVAAPSLQAAFDEFMARHWYPVSTVALGIWQGETLVARVLVARDNETGEPVPYLMEIDPPRQQSLACGD